MNSSVSSLVIFDHATRSLAKSEQVDSILGEDNEIISVQKETFHS